MTDYSKILNFDEKNGVIEIQSGVWIDRFIEIYNSLKGGFFPVSPGTNFAI